MMADETRDPPCKSIKLHYYSLGSPDLDMFLFEF